MVTDPSAGPAGPTRRRWWLIGGAAFWAVVLTGLAILSVRTEPPTVPDQVDLSDVMPAVDRATVAVLAAAGPQAVTVIGLTEVDRACSITPVREGREATRDVTVHVRAGSGPTMLDTIAAALPASYGAETSDSRGGARHLLYADAGDFVAVRGAVDAGDSEVALRVSTGCRPIDLVQPGTGGFARPDRSAGTVPAVVTEVEHALGFRSLDAARAREVACPSGRPARTVIDEGRADRSLGAALGPLTEDAVVVEADASRWAYRDGDVSMVVTDTDGTVQILATTGC